MLLRDSKYIIRRDTDKFREFFEEMESPLFLFDKAMERFFGNKRKTPACHRQAGYNWIRGNIFEGPKPKAFYFSGR